MRFQPITNVVDTRIFSLKYLILLAFFTLFSSHQESFGQSNRKDLENRRKTLLKEIENTNLLLSNTRQSKKTTLNRYHTLQKQIDRRQQLIRNLNEEISLADSSISRANNVVLALQDDTERLKVEYARIARKAYRLKLTNNSIAFLLSAQGLNDAFRRWQYLKEYDAYRQKQAKLIRDTQKTLATKATQLEQRRRDKQNLLLIELSQKNILERELSDSNHLLDKLKDDESRLTDELAAKKKAHEDLNRAIEKIILAEIERSKAEARKPITASETKTKSVPESAAAATALSKNFSQNKGRLPWPVGNGLVTRFFGTQNHPVLKKIQVTNNGIDIQTSDQAIVSSVFEGEVSALQFIPGNNYMVIIRHGDYFTVYSNLEEVAVKRGEKVKINSPIGKVGVDRITTQSELHFEIWHGKKLQDPIKWLSK